MAHLKAKNHIIYGDEAMLRRLKADYEFIGRECEIQEDRLVIFALPRKKKADKKRAPRRG